MSESNELKKCCRCRSSILLKYFSVNRQGKYYSSCDNCRKSKKESILPTKVKNQIKSHIFIKCIMELLCKKQNEINEYEGKEGYSERVLAMNNVLSKIRNDFDDEVFLHVYGQASAKLGYTLRPLTKDNALALLDSGIEADGFSSYFLEKTNMVHIEDYGNVDKPPEVTPE